MALLHGLTKNTIKRLTLYHFILNDFDESGAEFITSHQMAELLEIDDSQVRKDIKYVNDNGRSKIGYNVKSLKLNIEQLLGYKEKKNAFIVGAGNLGSALTKYTDLNQYGINLLALFDNDPAKVGMKINNIEVFNISELPMLTKQLKVEIAILTVPRDAAQNCAEFIADAGIKYIWNFTPRVLRVGVRVWNENLIGNFLTMVSE